MDAKPPGYAAYAPLLKDRTSEELFADAKALEGLTDHPGWQVLKELVGRKVEMLTVGMRHGSILDQTVYVRQNAMCSGMEQALDAPGAVAFHAKLTERDLARLAERMEDD